MGARPQQCSCCPSCPDVDPAVCPTATAPATNEHPASYPLNTTGAKDWTVETFHTTGVDFTHALDFPLVFIDTTGQRFDPLTAGAAQLELTATPGTGQTGWIVGVILWPAATVTPPDILSRLDGPVNTIGAPDARFRWIQDGIQNLDHTTDTAYLFSGACVRHNGDLYLQPIMNPNTSDRCWQRLPLLAPPAVGHRSYLSRQFRRPLQARDSSDDDITRLPPFSNTTTGGASVEYRPRDVLYRLDPDGDPLLEIDGRPEDWTGKYSEYGIWSGLTDKRLDLKDGTAPPVQLGSGTGNDQTTAATIAIDNLCLSVDKGGLYPTPIHPGLDASVPPVTVYGRGSTVLVDDPLDAVPTFGAGADQWHTQRYDPDIAPISTAAAGADDGFLTWTETSAGFDGLRPIALVTPWIIPAGPQLSETWRLCIEWTYREIDHAHRNYPTGSPPPPGGNYLRQTCGVGVPGLFGVEIMRDQWLAARRLGVQARTVGPTPYWLETGYTSPPSRWAGTYPTYLPPGNTKTGEFYSQTYWSNGAHDHDATPYDGSRIAVVAVKSVQTSGNNNAHRIDLHVYVDGVEVEFPSFKSGATGLTYGNTNAPHIENFTSWQFTDANLYLIGEYGGAWQDLKVTYTP